MAVVTNMAMSVDGFVAYPDDDPREIFDFYNNGDVRFTLCEGWPEFAMSRTSADLMQDAVARTGCHLVGRRLFDLTNGWDGHPGNEAPMVVLTHQPPTDWPRDGVSYHFVSDVAPAVRKAVELARDLDVVVAGAAASRACLDAGLLDVIDISLAPVIIGAGVPWFAGVKNTVRLSDPVVHQDHGVTHLRYEVLR